MSTSWNHRVIHEIHPEIDPEGVVGIVEVHYEGEQPVAWSEACLFGDDISELRTTLTRMMSALDHPVLTFDASTNKFTPTIEEIFP